MHITLAVQGKLKDPALKSLYEEYKKRLSWKLTLQEGYKDLPSSFFIVLDERGDTPTSDAFATLLKDVQLHHHGKVTFVIGDADGIPASLKAKAHYTLSFGRMTWPHLLARILLMEQLYRAQQILANHPYHRRS